MRSRSPSSLLGTSGSSIADGQPAKNARRRVPAVTCSRSPAVVVHRGNLFARIALPNSHNHHRAIRNFGTLAWLPATSAFAMARIDAIPHPSRSPTCLSRGRRSLLYETAFRGRRHNPDAGRSFVRRIHTNRHNCKSKRTSAPELISRVSNGGADRRALRAARTTGSRGVLESRDVRHQHFDQLLLAPNRVLRSTFPS